MIFLRISWFFSLFDCFDNVLLIDLYVLNEKILLKKS